MNIFNFRDELIDDYAEYIASFINVRDNCIRAYIEEKLKAGVLWPQPLIQLNPSFEPGAFVEDLVREGVLHQGCVDVFRRNKKETAGAGLPLRLHTHQEEAIRVARQGRNYVLTTGTGSGKSLSYIIPIVDRVLREGSGKGIKAIVVYLMNALANSQFGELEKFLCEARRSRPASQPELDKSNDRSSSIQMPKEVPAGARDVSASFLMMRSTRTAQKR